jgi:hypothetical protein
MYDTFDWREWMYVVVRVLALEWIGKFDESIKFLDNKNIKTT